MILTALVAMALTAPAGGDRLRTILPNGAVIVAESMPAAASMSVQLFVSTQRLGPTIPKGAVHLLEHLMLQRNPLLDSRAEREGLFFVGRTFRDALQIEVSGNPAKLREAMEIVGELASPLAFTEDEIRIEAAMIAQERATQPADGRLSTGAWIGAFGGDGYDPLGDPERLAVLAPADLSSLASSMFIGRNMVVSVCGPADCDTSTAAVRPFLERFTKGERSTLVERPAGVPARIEVPNTFGEVRAAIVPGYRDRGCAAALAAGLAIASQQPTAFFTYTPTVLQGMMIVGQTDRGEGIGLFVDEIDEQSQARLFPIGKSLAEGWVRGQLATPSGIAYLRGLLMSQGASNNPESLIDDIRSLTWDQFKSGVDRYRKGSAVVVVGV